VVRLANEVFSDSVVPRIKEERTWTQVYLSAADHLTHGRRNPVAEWLDRLDAFGLRSHEKRVPADVFMQPAGSIATFLRHLWATDGCVWLSRRDQRPYPAIYYATSSPGLARDVQSLLLRLEINAVIRPVRAKRGRPHFHVAVSGREEMVRFLEVIGAIGERRRETGDAIRRVLTVGGRVANTNRDVVPREVWHSLVKPAMSAAGVTSRGLQAAISTSYCGSTLYRSNLSRKRAARVAESVESNELAQLAASDVYWDRLASIEPDGVEEVFDLTVDGLHNFVADDLIVHNSIEQDADIVSFIYREDYYDHESERQGEADLIVAKHRNGPIGKVPLVFQDQYPRFVSMSREDEQRAGDFGEAA
jgi:replicative DNA helicase